ncbi:MAG: porin [Methylotenera sp.]|nr:porin [Methylotenera sp.]
MKKYPQFATSVIALAVSATFSLNSHAQDDAETRIRELENKVQLLIQQRADQDKQIDLLTKELVGIGNQVSQSKIAKSEEKGGSKGSPIYGAFKDGLTFEDGTGNWKLQLNGRVQADYRHFSPDDWKSDTFSIRRARLGGTFSFLKDFAVRVEGEYANTNDGSKGTTALTYGYLDFTRWSGAKIRAGQFKPFFGLERAQSTNFTDFSELSLATNNGSVFNSTYDRGLMVFGDPLPWLNYNTYIVNGTGQNNDDVKDSKDIGARVNVNLAKLTDDKKLVLHAGTSVSRGSIDFSSATKSIKQATEGNGVEFFNVSRLINATSTTDRSRFGLEGAVAYGPVKLQSEYIKANFEGRQGAGLGTAFDHDIKVWYADMNWLLTGEFYADAYKSGGFGRIHPKNNFDDKAGWGAFELGLRYSKFDASDFDAILASHTANVSEADAWTAGAKWIFNPNARLALNYVQTNFNDDIVMNGKRDDKEQAVTLRAQYDF